VEVTKNGPEPDGGEAETEQRGTLREMLEVDDWHGMDGTAGPAQ
jgi:hypothetical protein